MNTITPANSPEEVKFDTEIEIKETGEIKTLTSKELLD